MGLKAKADALRERKEQERSTKRCLLMRVRDAMAPEDQAELDSMVADTATFSAAELAGILAEEGIAVSSSTIAGHRAERQRCGCSK